MFFYKMENTGTPDTGMIVGVRLRALAPWLFAEESHETFRESLVKVVSQLKAQFLKRNSEIINHV